jgi:hypothetical protein
VDNKELRRIIREEVQKYLSKNQDRLFEMANARAEFIKKVEGFFAPMTMHILLLAYCKLYDQDNGTFNHWAHEVFVWAYDLCNMELKVKNQENVKFKVLFNIFNEKRNLDDYDRVKKWWLGAKTKENINFEFNEDIFKMFSHILSGIASCISKSDIGCLALFFEEDIKER